MRDRLQFFLWCSVIVSITINAAELTYSSLTAETAWEYQIADHHLEPGFIRLIAQAEFALTEALTAKAIISPCLGTYSTQPEGGTQCSKHRLVEELTLSGGFNTLDFVVGRQIVTQGNTEGFVILDRFNGRDLCRFARLDIQNKLPNWLAKGRAFFDDNTFTLTLAPLSAESEIPDYASYCNNEFYNLGQFSTQPDPGNSNLQDWAGGIEWAINKDSWNATFNAISTREDVFVIETVPTINKIRPRTWWLGGSAAVTLGSVVLRSEIAFAPERDFTISPNMLPSILGDGIITNGVDSRWNLLGVIGAEVSSGDWYWALQYYDDRVENGVSLVRDSTSHLASLRVRRTFDNEQIIFNSFAVLDVDYRDVAIRASIMYEFTEDMTLELGGTWYATLDDNSGFFGSYDGREVVFVNLKTNF